VTVTCAACGSCCDPVVLETDAYLGAVRRARSRESADEDDRFIARSWHPLYGWRDEDGTSCLALSCDAFNPETRACTAREDRPPVCRGFPWYGREPSAKTAAPLSPQCSYLADVGPQDRPPGSRPLLPLTVITVREAA
jgi:Fe-S-cluster containining protein